MIPFRAFNREKKEMWIILNHQSGASGGDYLAARLVDSEAEGEMQVIAAKDLAKFRFEGFIEGPEE